MPPSRPKPYCLNPPNEANGSWLMVLISTPYLQLGGYPAGVGLISRAHVVQQAVIRYNLRISLLWY